MSNEKELQRLKNELLLRDKIILCRDEIVAQQKKIIDAQLAEIGELHASVTDLKEFIEKLNKKIFGRSAEPFVDGGLHNEAEDINDKAGEVDDGPGEDSEDLKEPKKRGKRKPLPEHLLRSVTINDLEHKSCSCGCELKLVGEDVSEKLAIIPAKLYVDRKITRKYACPRCESMHAALVPEILPKTNATPSLLAFIIVAKYKDSLPLYRQESIFLRLGIQLTRQTMARWVIMVSQKIAPLITLLREIALDSNYLQMDETTLQVLNVPDKEATSKSYMWVMNCPEYNIFLFHYAPTRSGEVPLKLLEGFKGLLQVDGYDGYNKAITAYGLTRLGCWMHGRRPFFEAFESSSKKIGEYGLKLIKKIYKIESTIKNETPEIRLNIRQTQSLPLAEKLKEFCLEHQSKITPTSYGGKSINYLLNEWNYLKECFNHGQVDIDNGASERVIKPFAVGRKNWLFSDTESGAQASADLTSLQQTAIANGYNEWDYFLKLFTELPHAKTLEDYLKLLPLNKIPPPH